MTRALAGPPGLHHAERSEKTLDSFVFDADGFACAAHLFQAGTSQCINTFVVRVTRVSLDPTPFDGMAGSQRIQAPP
jgi:hypothetical protein